MIVRATLAAVLPLLLLLFPGVALAPLYQRSVGSLVRLILWSLSIWTLVSFSVALLGVPSYVALALVTALTVTICLLFRKNSLPAPWFTVGLSLMAYAALGFAFWHFHDLLPSGDSQKAVFWAQEVLRGHSLPNYEQSIELLNRDPVDFYTPGLHSLTALLLQYSPLPLASVGFFSLAAGIAVALVAVACVQELLPETYKKTPLAGVAALLVIGNYRFLRYLREPGYHYQNLIGELLLFGLLLLALSLVSRWRWSDVLLGVLVAVTLLLSHQFSAFLGAFVLLPAVLILFIKYTHRHIWANFSAWRIVALLSIVVAVVWAGFILGLHHKIPHIFTSTPHLSGLILPWFEYPRTLGFVWVYGGLLGLVGLSRLAVPQKNLAAAAFSGALIIFFALSIGPIWGVDIPPVRALLYVVVPLSISFTIAIIYIRHLPLPLSRLLAALLVVTACISSVNGVKAAFRMNHAIRTNSTLLPEQLTLAGQLSQHAMAGAVIADDYNRRSSSWLVLSDRPMYTRLAADVRTHMAEAKQSPLREELYLNQLDYEKIFSLASLPEVASLLSEHQIGLVTGIAGSSYDGFAHNPALTPALSAGDITLFASAGSEPSTTSDISTWLLRPSTLANDIGDLEDTYEHLPAALRTSRLSAPQVAQNVTYRTTRSPHIVLRFNVRDFVSVLWAKEGRPSPDAALEFYVQLRTAAPDLALKTASGWEAPLVSHAMMRLEASVVPFDADGFVTLFINNPRQQAVEIDLIALGLARTL